MLSRILKTQVLFSVLVLFALIAEAGPRSHRSRGDNEHSQRQTDSYNRRDQRNYEQPKRTTPAPNYNEGTDVTDDSELIAAIRKGRSVQFLMAANLEVIQVLPDDTSGLQHQKWIVRLSNGQKVQAVYNSDMCPRVPVNEGDRVTLAGMFLMTGQGAMMHWLHHDPRGKRPDGFVELNGERYCDK